MNLNDGVHYNWLKTLSYNADITMVISAPNLGKTYGIRGYALMRYLSKGRRFVEVCRTKTEKRDVKGEYLDKLLMDEDSFAGLEARCSGNHFQIKREGGKWETCGYITSLTEVQKAKKMNYINVETIIMDEAIIEKIDSVHTYKRREWDLLSRITDSCSRENWHDEKRTRPHVYLLGNAVDLVNPYFQVFGIKTSPKYGYSWYWNKQVLVHYVEPTAEDEARRLNTLAGRMGSMTGYAQATYGNDFAEDTRYIAKKPKRAKFLMGCVYRESKFGIWVDMTEGFYYVASKIPKDAMHVYSLTRSDDSPNLIAARRGTKALQYVVDSYYEGSVLFETPRIRETFLEAMALFGVR